MSNLDESSLQTRTVDAAQAMLRGDLDTARQQLQSALDLLHEAREYFYPVEAHLLDLTIVPPTMIGAELRTELARRAPTNLLLSAETIQEIARREPETLAAIVQGLDAKSVSLIGGEIHELPLPLLPPEAIARAIVRGRAAFAQCLGRELTLYGRRRFGLTPILPEILQRLRFAGGLHFTLDDGQFPTGNQSRIRWEAFDGSVLEALARVPIDASLPQTFLRLPEKLGEVLDLDHAGTLVFAHWPGCASPWYEAVERIAAYTPVFGTFATLADYFSATDLSGQVTRYEPDAYKSPYLRQAVSAGQVDPISRYVRYYSRWSVAEAWQAIFALDALLSGRVAEASPAESIRSELEDSLEGPSDATLDARLRAGLDAAIAGLARLISGSRPAEPTGQLLINALDFSRRMWTEEVGSRQPAAGSEESAVAADEHSPERGGESKIQNPKSKIPCVGAEVPGMGFAWVAQGQTAPAAPSTASRGGWWGKRKRADEPPMAEQLAADAQGILRNDFFEVHISPTLGSVESVFVYGSRGNRMSQQVAFRLPQAEAAYSIMAADEMRITAAGPMVGEIVCRGRLLDRQARRLAGFVQTTRVRRGSRILELEIELDPEQLPQGDPWQSYYAARFAWSDESAELYRSVNTIGRRTDAKYLEAPHFLDLRAAGARTVILPGGLPFHRRASLRMLDTLLVVPGESARKFRLGVGFDIAHPLAAALSFMAPQTVASGVAAPASPSGWLFHLDSRNVSATHWEPIVAAGQVEGFRVRLLETEGRGASVGLRSFRSLGAARRLDDPPVELPVEGDRVKVEIRPYQWVEVECRWNT
jgi:alpha-mannosidase